MAFNGASSYTATVSPAATETFSNPLLASSISSLSSPMTARHSSSSISKTYRQASTLFLTRRLPEALSTLQPLIAPPPPPDGDTQVAEPAPVAAASRTTRVKVWSLYLTILNAVVELEAQDGKDAFGAHEWRNLCAKVRDGDVWEEVVRNGYHGSEGSVDSDVVINLATLLLAHAKTQALNQKRLENYLAASQTPHLDLSSRFPSSSSPHPTPRYRSPAKSTSGAETPRDLNSRVKILELYTLHVLLRNNEWEYAKEFISVNAVLDEERREAFLQALQSLQEEQQLAEQREREETHKKEDEARRYEEEARRLKTENQERERRRVEEERAKREGSEVDYGVEATPSASGSFRGRHARNSSGLSRPSIPTRASTKPVAASSLSSRAGAIVSNLQALVEHMSRLWQANPGVILRLLAFVVGFLVMFGRRDMRARLARVMGSSWNKIKATAGMGVKVSYI